MRQIGIEFHEVPTYIKEFFTIIQELYKLGFVTIIGSDNVLDEILPILNTLYQKVTTFDLRIHNLETFLIDIR